MVLMRVSKEFKEAIDNFMNQVAKQNSLTINIKIKKIDLTRELTPAIKFLQPIKIRNGKNYEIRLFTKFPKLKEK